MSESGRNIASAAGLLAASVLLARLLGFVRDALFATHVGIGPAADAYFAAFMIPDMFELDLNPRKRTGPNRLPAFLRDSE